MKLYGVRHMRSLIKSGLFISGCLISLTATAFEIVTEFSADAVQSISGQPSMNAKLYVSKNAVRTESVMNGSDMAEIVYMKDKRRVLLNKRTKKYIEQKFLSEKMKPESKKTKEDTSPCISIADATCKKLGKEIINDRETIKWEMTVKRNGRSYKSLHWLDKKYYMPIREQFQDGTISTMTLSAKEKIDDRETERWYLHAIRPDGQTIESQQWYDPNLKMVIKEELPGGYVRELRNIKVSKQDKKLFQIPSDYQKEIIPEMNSQAQMLQDKSR
jgi:outer membrane lipoprotein-sorting protein